MASQHTPGPWTVGRSGITVITENWSVSVPLRLPEPGEEHDMCEGAKADARLIAAAPEMYGMLAHLIQVDGDPMAESLDITQIADAARALLARIEGR